VSERGKKMRLLFRRLLRALVPVIFVPLPLMPALADSYPSPTVRLRCGPCAISEQSAIHCRRRRRPRDRVGGRSRRLAAPDQGQKANSACRHRHHDTILTPFTLS
jgi:hypothetical protein